LRGLLGVLKRFAQALFATAIPFRHSLLDKQVHRDLEQRCEFLRLLLADGALPVQTLRNAPARAEDRQEIARGSMARFHQVSQHLERGRGGQRVVAVVVGLNQDGEGLQQRRFLDGQIVLALVHEFLHGGNHPVVLFLGLDGFDDDAIRQTDVLLSVDYQRRAHAFHTPFTYSLCVLLPPMSNTTYGATKSAVLNVCFTSAKFTQVARLATLYQWSRGLDASRRFSQKVRIALWLTTFIGAGPMVP